MNAGGAERHYRTMGIEDICAVPVCDLAADDAALFMWGTWPQLAEGLRVVAAWGFTYKTCAFVWLKSNRSTEIGQSLFFTEDADVFWGMGRWTRANTEICLLGIRGQPKRLSAAVHQVIYAPIAGHSMKPPETRDRIVQLMGDLPRVELFARQTTPGWDVWGNEAKNGISIPAMIAT